MSNFMNTPGDDTNAFKYMQRSTSLLNMLNKSQSFGVPTGFDQSKQNIKDGDFDNFTQIVTFNSNKEEKNE